MQDMLDVQMLEVIDDRFGIHHSNNLDQEFLLHKNHREYYLHIVDPNHPLHDHLFKNRNLITFIYFIVYLP
jgi:hypothetical protein